MAADSRSTSDSSSRSSPPETSAVNIESTGASDRVASAALPPGSPHHPPPVESSTPTSSGTSEAVGEAERRSRSPLRSPRKGSIVNEQADDLSTSEKAGRRPRDRLPARSLDVGTEPTRSGQRRVTVLDSRGRNSRGSSGDSAVSDEMNTGQRRNVAFAEGNDRIRGSSTESATEERVDQEKVCANAKGVDRERLSAAEVLQPPAHATSEPLLASNSDRRHGRPPIRSPLSGLDSPRGVEQKSSGSPPRVPERVLERSLSGSEVSRGNQRRAGLTEGRGRSRSSSAGNSHEKVGIPDGTAGEILQPSNGHRQRSRAPSRSPPGGVDVMGKSDKHSALAGMISRAPDRVAHPGAEPVRPGKRRIAVIDGRGRSRNSSTGSIVSEDVNGGQQRESVLHEQERAGDHISGAGREPISSAKTVHSYGPAILPIPTIPSDLSVAPNKSRRHDRMISRPLPTSTEPARVPEKSMGRDEADGRLGDRPKGAIAESKRATQRRIAVVDGRGRSRGSSVGSAVSEDVNGVSHRIAVVDGRQRSSRASAKNTDVDELAPARVKGYYLIGAAAKGDLERVKKILDEEPTVVNFVNYDRRTPLHLAAAEDHNAVVKELVERGADMEARDRYGRNPVEEAVLWGSIRALRVFAKCDAPFPQGVEPLSVDSNYWHGRDLLEAAARGNLNAVRQLIMIFGANMNWQNADGRTALHLASANKHREVVKFLLQQGADPCRKDRRGKTPMDEAKSSNDVELYHLFEGHDDGRPRTGGKARREGRSRTEGKPKKEKAVGTRPEIRVITGK